MRRQHALVALVLSVGCTGPTEPAAPIPAKDEIPLGKTDNAALCARYGLPPDCDVCQEFGWYGDGVCDERLVADGTCQGPDPDCFVVTAVLGDDPSTFHDDALYFGKDGRIQHDIGFRPYARSYLALREGPLRYRHGSSVPPSRLLTDEELRALEETSPGAALDQAARVFGWGDLWFESAASSPQFYNPGAAYWEGKCHAWCWSSLHPWANAHVEVEGPRGLRGLWIGGQWISRADLGNWLMGLSDNFARREEAIYNETNLTAAEILHGVWQYLLAEDASGVIADIFLDRAHGHTEVWNQPFFAASLTSRTLSGEAAQSLLERAGREGAVSAKFVQVEASYAVEVGDDNEDPSPARVRRWNFYVLCDARGEMLEAYMADDPALSDIASLPTHESDEAPERWWKPSHVTLEHALDGSEDLLLDFIDSWNGRRLRFFLTVVLAKGVPATVREAFESDVADLGAAPTDEQARELAARYPGVANAYSPEEWDRAFGRLGLEAEVFGADWQTP